MLFEWNDSGPGPDLEIDGPEKTGPARFWELIKGELANVLIVNLLFLAAFIPVVTIPPAVFSLHMVMRKIVLGEAVSCVRDYFTAFRQGWKGAYGAFFLTVIPMGAAGYGALFYLRRAMVNRCCLPRSCFAPRFFGSRCWPPPICMDCCAAADCFGMR